MFRSLFAPALILTAAVAFAACGDDPVVTAPTETPVSLTEPFAGRLTINGAATHLFTTQRAGNASATITSLSPDSAAVISLSLGTWNGSSCQIIIAKDDATTNAGVIGTASAGSFCVRLLDVGKLTAPTDYEITVTHF
jgi:hypothetical protein